MKITRKQLRQLLIESILNESAEGKARDYSLKNPKVTVHLFDPEKNQVIVIKDGEDKERIDAEPGTKKFKNLAADRSGSAFTDKVKAFNFDIT
jgi:hypothetical protein